MTPPDGWPLSSATLHRLPPAHLMNERTERYPGGTFAVPLAAFALPDQVLLRELYQMLTGLWGLLTATHHTDWPVLLAGMRQSSVQMPALLPTSGMLGMQDVWLERGVSDALSALHICHDEGTQQKNPTWVPDLRVPELRADVQRA